MEGKRKSAEQIGVTCKKSTTQVCIRHELTGGENVKCCKEAWVNEYLLNDSNFNILNEPFKICIVKDFINDESFLYDLINDLSSLNLISKNNDLYQLHQSEDLANVNLPTVSKLENFLHGQCLAWMQEVTGIELDYKVSATYSCYKETDYLLCHDDRCENRRIAFIIYLNNNWEPDDGGALQLFEVNDCGQPVEAVHSIFPKFNSFVFFEVTDKSFHQVAEVLSSDKKRISVNGWFHSSVQCTQSGYREQEIIKFLPHPLLDDDLLNIYINPCYLNESYYSEVSGIFEEESQISLVKFLKDVVFNSICEALHDDQIEWEKKGPYNRCQYFVPRSDTLPSCVKSFADFLSSSSFFMFLRKLTQLDLGSSSDDHAECSSNLSSDSRYFYEIQKWERGCYSLLNDDDPIFKESALDAVMFFNVEGLEEYHGGYISYIARDEDLELLTVNPVENSLALTYRDNETLRFMKYINHLYPDKFYSISFVYSE